MIDITMVKQMICLLLALACFLYGNAIRSVGSGTKFYMVWTGMGVLFLLAGEAVNYHIAESMPRWLLAVAGGLLVLLLLAVIVLGAVIVSHFNDKAERDLDYIIVLGAQIREKGPSIVLKYRLDTAAEYLQANPDTMCIVTGAQGDNEPCTEAEGMAGYLVSRGIAETRILQERQAVNTLQNIRNSSTFFDKETAAVGIVTNNFHVYRALRIARKQGLEHACGIAADSRGFYMPNNCLREILGLAKDLLKGNI